MNQPPDSPTRDTHVPDALEGDASAPISRAGPPVGAAVRGRSAEWVAEALANGGDANEQDKNGMTPLHHAAALGARPCIRVLVASGQCDYLLRDRYGRYAYELAIEHARDFAVARLLMKKQRQQAHARGVPAYVTRGPDREAGDGP